MPAIHRVLETALNVRDLQRSATFYESLFGFRRLLDDSRLVGLEIPGEQVLLLFHEGASTKGEATPGGFIPPHDGYGTQHVAFAIGEEDVSEWEGALAAHGVPLESKVHPENGGISLYFRDPDNHLVELAVPHIWHFGKSA